MKSLLTIIKKHKPINMENGKINCVFILNGISSLMTKTISDVKKFFKFEPVVRPTNTEGITMPVEFCADMCSIKNKSNV